MKFLLISLFIASCSVGFSQKIVKILNSCNADKTAAYLEKKGGFNKQIKEYSEDGEELILSLLTYSVEIECIENVTFFLKHKEEFDDFDLALSNAFIFSLSVGNDEISNLLYAEKPLPKGICTVCHGSNALMVAATYGREEWYKKLKPTSDPTYINQEGVTLLHAAASGSSELILDDVLHTRGLDINAKDQEGLTALDYAASNTDNLFAFQLLLNHGADYKEAWNLLYWWSMYPFVLSPEMINERRSDVWYIDEEGDNCLMLLSYFFSDIEQEAGVFSYRLKTIIDFMLEDFKEGKGNYNFVELLYSNGITINILNAMLYIEDFNSDEAIYPKYLELIGYICDHHDFCPVYKKEFKDACAIYGEEVVTKWYMEFNLPTKE